MFIPHGYTAQKQWPVIMFLHGVGEGGTDAQHNLTVGLAPAVAERAATFPFIVVFPQSASGHWDEDSNAAADAIAALDQVEHDYAVDRDRVFLTGVSTGGYGTWAIGAKYKDHFTGLVPLCAFSDFKDVSNLTDMPIWCFHNAGDPFVLAAGSHAMCNQINDKGGHAQYTEYLAVGHDVWSHAYNKEELYQWMLDTHKNPMTRSNNHATITASVVEPQLSAPPTYVPSHAATVAPIRTTPKYVAPTYVAPHTTTPTVSDRPSAPLTPPAQKPDQKPDMYVPMVW